MRIKQREHNRIVRAGEAHGGRLDAHGVWTRTVRAGGMEQTKQEYAHFFSTDDPNRFLVHLVDGDQWSSETAETVEEMREDFEAA